MMKYKSWIWFYFKIYKYCIFFILLLSLLMIGFVCVLMFMLGYLILVFFLWSEMILLVYVLIVFVCIFGLS